VGRAVEELPDLERELSEWAWDWERLEEAPEGLERDQPVGLGGGARSCLGLGGGARSRLGSGPVPLYWLCERPPWLREVLCEREVLGPLGYGPLYWL
jgi:hypothetical protein